MKKLLLIALISLFSGKIVSQITVSQQQGCTPLTVNFSYPTVANAVYYEWWVDNNPFSSGQTLNNTFVVPGYHNVDMRVYDANSNIIRMDYSYVTVYGFSGITSSLLNGEGCLGDRLGFNLQANLQDWNNISVTWDYGDGSPAVSGNSTWGEHQYGSVGTYTVTADVNSVCGPQSFTYAVNVTTSAPIGNVYVEASSSTSCPGDLIYFYHPAGGNNFLMNYGDGTQEVGTREHRYYVPGTYVISCTFFNGCGNSATAYDTVVISNNVQIPQWVNYFSVSDTSVCPTTNVNFYPPSSFSNYSWNFGDGTTSTLSYPSKAYSSVGNYNVTLQITNGCGDSKTINKTIHVQNNIPVAPFTIGVPDSVCPSTSAVLAIPDPYSNDNSPQMYFNFGDGTTAIAQNQREITHAYSTPGTYTVTATVVNGCGQSYSYTSAIVANSAATLQPGSFMAGSPMSSACPGDSVFFLISPPDVGSVLYDFGDGATSTTPTNYVTGPDGIVYAIYKHAYATTGIYNSNVTVTSPCGSVLSMAAGNITISNNNAIDGDASFFFDKSKYYCLNEPIEFNAYGASSYEWNFGDGTGSVVSNASLVPVYHAYSLPGTYTIKVTLRNSCGAVDTVSNEIFIPDSRVNISTSTVSSTCGHTNGKAIAIVNGNNPPYSYNWTNGDRNFIADTLTAGIYYVTITDSKGCSNFAVATVSDQQAPTISINNVIDANCYGESSGAIDITLIGSSSPYSVVWSNGRTSEDVNQLAAGPYEVIVTDANGCRATKSITIDEPEDFTITYVSYPSVCGFNTGVIQTSVQGNSGPYNYLWSNGYTGASVSGLAVGVYSLTVVDSKGCLKEKIATVSEQSAPIAVLDSVSTLDCNVSSGANVYVSTYLGSAPYTYNWSNGVSTEDLTNAQPGFYSLLVTGANGCKSVLTATIEESIPEGLNVCAVTVDSLTHTNKVIWEMYNRTDIESFNVYRESSQSGLYFLVGNVDADSLHEFTDPSADPSIRGWRYKISTVNFCGEESERSDLHKTIHLTLNEGIGNTINLIWDNYEGLTFNQFYIWRYTTQDGWVKIDSLPANLFSYTDVTAPSTTVSPDLYYYIEGGPIVECDPTRGAINTTRSNIKSPSSVSPIGIQKLQRNLAVTLYPNPAQTSVTVSLGKSISAQVEITNALGSIVFSGFVDANNTVKTIDVSSLNNGIYFVKVHSAEGNSVQRLVISK